MKRTIYNGIKSKERVSKFGEVFTPENIVRDMINRIPEDVRNNIDATWLEPACGNGNFLVAILSDKLDLAEQLGLKNYDINVFRVVCRIYGIEIQADNVEESRARMMELIKLRYKQFTGKDMGEKLGDAIEYVLTQNIIWGNTLTEMCMKDNSDILIAEWTIDGEYVIRRDFTLGSMRKNNLYYGIPTRIYKRAKYIDVMNMVVYL